MIMNRQVRQGRQEKRFLKIPILGVPGVLAVNFFLLGILCEGEGL
jgi:hypothetical protein